jgi:hypothetical protein
LSVFLTTLNTARLNRKYFRQGFVAQSPKSVDGLPAAFQRSAVAIKAKKAGLFVYPEFKDLASKSTLLDEMVSKKTPT